MLTTVIGVRLVGHMVTRNEEDRYLARCLEWFQPIVDDIVVFDDQSTDRTRDVCKAHGAFVTVRGADTPPFLTDEAVFRTAGWATLRSVVRRDDWVLCLDADEFLVSTTADPVRAHLERMAGTISLDGYWFPVREVFGVEQGVPWVRTDGQWGKITATRFCRYGQDSTFASRRLGCGSVPASVRSTSVVPGVDLLHYGYARAEDRKVKWERYQRPGHSTKHVASIISRPVLVRYPNEHPDVR